MIQTYSDGVLLNIVYRASDIKDDREDITKPDEDLQCGIMKVPAGKNFSPHKHITRKGKEFVHVQEAFIILSGVAEITIYDDSIIDTIKLYPGDLSVLLHGGHSLKVIEDAVIYEIKTGPYLGKKYDKIMI